VIDARWEHGSEFHWLDAPPCETDPDREWLLGLRSVAYATGRGALRALCEHGGWGRVWLPSHVCAELVAAVGDRARFYPCDPVTGAGELAATAGDAVVRIDYFGLRGLPSAAPLRAREIVVIDDHTHDPCSDGARESDADYGFASLRKSLPLPDGALVWSRERPLPSAPEPCDEAAAKLPAMLLKGLYLRGHAIDKSVFRELAIAGEARLGGLGSVGISRVSGQWLASLAIASLRAKRRDNFAAFVAALGDRLDVLRPEPNATPFACVLRLRDRSERDRIRAELIEQRIYPAVLWDLDEIPQHCERFPRTCEIADQLLAVHCDARYDAADMQRVASALAAERGQ
jgi:hypothetical protein